MRRGALAAAGAVALAAGLVLYLPAALVSGWAEAAVPGLRLAGVTGTALKGRAAQVSFRDTATLRDLRWRARPLALLTGRAAVDIRVATDVGEVNAMVLDPLFGTGTGLQNITGQASIGWLARFGGYRFMPVGGRVRVDIARVELSDDGRPRQIEGNAAVENLSWRLMDPPLPLGAVTLRLAAVDGATVAEAVDSEGPLAVAGYARMDGDGVYRLDLRLRPRGDADPRLAKLLSNLGRADAGGWRRVIERGRL